MVHIVIWLFYAAARQSVRRGLRLAAGFCLIAAVLANFALAQEPPNPPLDGQDGRPLALETFRPQSMLKVEEHHLTRAKFPVVDVHSHFFVRLRHSPEQLDAFVKVMDRNQIAVCVSLDGTLGERFNEHIQHLSKYADRFVVFANLDFRGSGNADDPATWDVNRPDFARRVARQLAEAKPRGAAGLKLFKDFGLKHKNADGS